jgi:hypothetical protein
VARAGGDANLDRGEAEQRFEAFVWVLDDETDPTSVGCAWVEQLGEAGPRTEVRDDELDLFGGLAQELVETGTAESVACPYPVITSPVACAASSLVWVGVGARTGSGQSASSVVSSAPATLARFRRYGAVRPASQRCTVLTSTWTMSANSSSVSPARVIAVLRCSFSNPHPFRKPLISRG